MNVTKLLFATVVKPRPQLTAVNACELLQDADPPVVSEIAKIADALALVTEWPQYRDLDWARMAASMNSPVILDGRHWLDAASLSRAGFRNFRL